VKSLPLRTHQKTFIGDNHPALRCLKQRQRFRQHPNTHLCIVRSDGTLLPVLLVVSPLIEKGKCTGGIAVFQDVTEERQLDYMKSEFIALASHQLRTPLSAILWYIELLVDNMSPKLNAEQRAYITEMHTSAKRMAGLIDALLQVSRLEGGDIQLNKKSVDMQRFLHDITEQSKDPAKDRGVALVFHSSRRSVKVRTDETLFSIVMQNILSNAVKYSKQSGQIVVTLDVRRGSAVILVEDSGIGIPEKEQQHLFQKLFRAENVHKVDATGSGLGLFISKMVMETLGGSISLKSKEGKGTTVTVRLPMKRGK
jgi:two-component system sensor histidine kinase VicK